MSPFCSVLNAFSFTCFALFIYSFVPFDICSIHSFVDSHLLLNILTWLCSTIPLPYTSIHSTASLILLLHFLCLAPLPPPSLSPTIPGAFHSSKPSDLLAELQGRLPIKVMLKGLTEEDMYRILTEPITNLIRQQVEMIKTGTPKSSSFRINLFWICVYDLNREFVRSGFDICDSD
jgi:hypothetical protein